MKRLILITVILFTLNSCNSQNKVNLLEIKFGSNIDSILSLSKFNKERIAIYGLNTYNANDLSSFKIGNVELKSFQYPDGNLSDYNNLDVCVSSYEENSYLGFKYKSIEPKESEILINYFINKYKNVQDRSSSRGNGYFIELTEKGAWLFITQDNISIDKKGNRILTTEFLYLKEGTRIDNSLEKSINTVLQTFDMLHPKQ